MRLILSHSCTDVQKIKDFYEAKRNLRLVEFRASQNLAKHKPVVTMDRFWRALVCMRLTSRQKSGPDSAVVALVRAQPFPLRLEKLRSNRNSLVKFIASELRAVKGMRDYDVAAVQLATNFKMLEGGRWEEFLSMTNGLRGPSSQAAERSVSNAIQDAFKGFGPKQSRNFLQALGLTRYEIPLDSRVMKWMKSELKFPLPISGGVLADADYYELVLGKVQELCKEAKVMPCMLDAAIFASSDDDTWLPEMMKF